MAGIGFKLNKMFYRGSALSDFRAIMYSMIVSAGPWIITTFSLWIILYFLKLSEIYLSVALIYGFILSVIFSGLSNLVLTRRISDLIYLKEYKKIFPETLGVILVADLILVTYNIVFFTINRHPLWFSVSFTYLSVSLLSLWIISVASVSTDNVQFYIMNYITFGITAAFSTAFFHNTHFESIVAFAVAVNASIVLHAINVIRTFSTEKIISFEWFKASKKYWENFFIGFIYNLSIWMDDFVVWFSQRYGEEPLKGFRFSFYYDIPMFVAYLSIIPTVTMFVLVLETRFYNKYREFYDLLMTGAILKELEFSQKAMEDEMKKSVELTVVIQIFFSSILFILNELGFIRNVFDFERPILRIGIIGAMFNGFYLMIILLLLYYDFRRIVLYLNSAALGTNFLLSIWFVKNAPFTLLASSYAITFAIYTFVAYFILIRNVRKILQIEFSRQKIDIQRGKIKRLKDLKTFEGGARK